MSDSVRDESRDFKLFPLPSPLHSHCLFFSYPPLSPLPLPSSSLPRDLKPENSMLSGDGHVVLVDFGSAKQLRQDERTSTFVGETGTAVC